MPSTHNLRLRHLARGFLHDATCSSRRHRVPPWQSFSTTSSVAEDRATISERRRRANAEIFAMERRRQQERQQNPNSDPNRPFPNSGTRNDPNRNRMAPVVSTMGGYRSQYNGNYGPGPQPGGEGGKLLRLNRAHTAFGAQKQWETQNERRGGGQSQGNRARGTNRRASGGKRPEAVDPEETELKNFYQELFGESADPEEAHAENENDFLPDPEDMNYFMGDPPQNREPVPYTPEPVTIEALRQDWPAFPSSSLALTESIEEKLRWLSRRIAHSHPTTMELAQRLFKGELVHFQSTEEREEVEKLAREMAVERAQKLSGRANATETHEPVAVAFQPLAGSDRGELARRIVRGEYVEPAVEGNEVMERIAMNLRNNGTYGEEDTDKFFGKLREIVGGGPRVETPRVGAT